MRRFFRLGVRWFPFLLEAVEAASKAAASSAAGCPAAPGTSVVWSPPGVHRMPAATLSKQAHVEGGAITHQPPACSLWAQGPVSERVPRVQGSLTASPHLQPQGGLEEGAQTSRGSSWGMEGKGGAAGETRGPCRSSGHTLVPRRLLRRGLASRCCVPRVTPAERPCRLRRPTRDT